MSDSRKRGGAGASSRDEVVAGNGLVHRRALLGKGLMIAGAAGVGAGMTGAAAEPLREEESSTYQGKTIGALGARSKFEDKTIRVLSNPKGEPRTQHARTPHHLLNGTITPSHLHFTILHNGIPDIDPEKQARHPRHGETADGVHARQVDALPHGDAANLH
jgi:sulfane dehydrogenase subunit SoxC